MTPAQQLVGRDLGNGWKVVRALSKSSTGGNFSHGYVAEHSDGRQGFLKAIDYYRAFGQPFPPSDVLPILMNAYVFEKTLCRKVAHLSRVSHALADGAIDMDPKNPFAKVEYLIFELATGDIRAHLDLQADLDLVFALNTIHQVATGLSQLHSAKIAHQDLKPSNVLLFPLNAGSKICDLGRAWDSNVASPFDKYEVAGDPAYRTIEAMYGVTPATEQEKRFGCDMYHLGSLIVFMFCRAHMNALVLDCLEVAFRPGVWGGTYAQLLPYLEAAFDSALTEALKHMPDSLRDEMRVIVCELCNPNPSRRGHPRNRGCGQFSFERYISKFNLLAHRVEVDLVKHLGRAVE